MDSFTYIPPGQRPKPRKGGPIDWLNTNLFSGPSNTAISLVTIAAMSWVLFQLFEWAVLRSVWNAGSRGECRDVITSFYGDSATGACWAVFNGRVTELLIGSYPPVLIWRPIAAFALILAALSPVLVTTVPRSLLWISVTCPFVAHVLVFVGSALRRSGTPTLVIS
ncbi:MAG: hypothetical protein AAF557_03790 [Pseudomonadota bacterium]